METGRIILKAQLSNLSPIGIGSGRDDRSDRDVVTTKYAIDANGSILPSERFLEKDKVIELPFIPSTSFMGAIQRNFDTKTFKQVDTYWGESEKNASFIDCSEILITHLPSYIGNGTFPTEIRDGIRLNAAKGTVAKGAKFDYELLAPGAKFDLVMIFRVEPIKQDDGSIKSNYNQAYTIASDIARIIEKGFDLGSKSAVGYGKMKGETSLYTLNFNDKEQFTQWINNYLFENPLDIGSGTFLISDSALFEINATFRIKNSLIIRSYSKDPKAPDSTHLKSGGKNILSGTSIKGALRGRAERILNTIQDRVEITETILAGLFGDVEKEEDGVTVKPNGYTVPSRVFVDEIPIEEVKEEVQTRIQIDRFTGGTVDGALIEEVPLFPEKDKEQIKNFRIEVREAQPMDKGLMLLLLKDLWTADLPIGGEKAIGRGVLEGVKASLNDGDNEYVLLDDFKNHEKVKILQGYVDALKKPDNYRKYYDDRMANFKNKKR